MWCAADFGFVLPKKREVKDGCKHSWLLKGRNLQLSNKSLRLNPGCDWLKRATWPRLYEHELYAVVYSLLLPLYQRPTKMQGAHTRLFPRVSVETNPARPFRGAAACHIFTRSSRLPGGGIFGTVAAYAKPLPAMISPPLLPTPLLLLWRQ